MSVSQLYVTGGWTNSKHEHERSIDTGGWGIRSDTRTPREFVVVIKIVDSQGHEIGAFLTPVGFPDGCKEERLIPSLR
jgi:hypothetical protein